LKFVRTISAGLALLLGVTAGAQQKDVLSAFSQKAQDNKIDFTYNYVSGSLRGSGNASVQKDCFLLVVSDFEMYCDGREMWTVNRESQEAMVEPVDSPETAGAVNPALIIANLDKAFDVKSYSSTTYSGHSAVKYVLVPKTKSVDITELTAVIAADASRLYSVKAKVKDGTVTDFTFPSFSISSAADVSAYRLTESSFPNSYIITDLR